MSDYDNEFRLIKSKPRSKKLHHRVDLTAMVSVSFLLIIFFMVTMEALKPRSLELGLPDREGICGRIGCGFGCYRSTTLLLDEHNKIISYKGNLIFPEEKPKSLTYNQNSIRRELLKANYKAQQLYGKDRGAIVIIKPTKKSSFGNLVDILDEMAITNIPTYAIVNDLTPEEAKLLAMN